ncbi:ABC transporter substrate-binding protein [Actinomadura parmotrematis]|uniref:ABC transporter substrate-binding protein n=1 Tax=Actinomadura parmotrematis TaxID=2864039 RepID=A0ABS7G444_9ACTN|nr:ABC transporter substrate-binding protein [Actinomadura parmotrematis]MBW8486624.1 ABC transporter substrate-binding protein [Actinomadura parmotrematis]
MTSRFLKAALAVLLPVTGAAACGTSDAADALTLRIGVISAGKVVKLGGAAGYLDSKGELLPELKGLGITKIKVATFQNGPDLNQALAGGSLDLGVYGDTPALVGRGTKLPTRLISQPGVGLDAAVVTKKGGVSSLKELEGKKIGVQVGSYIHRYLLGALQQAGVHATLVNMYTPAIVAALEKGAIDAGGLVSANVEIERRKGLPVIDTASRDHPDLLGTTATVVTQKFLDAHPGIVKSWQNVERTGARAAKADWTGYTGYLASIGGYPADITAKTTLRSQVADQPFTPQGLKLLEGTKAFLVQQKLIPADYPLDSWIAPGARG